MIHVLHDTPGGYNFIERWINLPVTRHDSPQGISRMKSWLAGSWGIVKGSRRGDTIVCVLDIQAVMCYLLSQLTLRRRRIFAINLLLKRKPTLRNRLTARLYKLALRSRDFRATVTSPYYGEWLNSVYGMSHHYDLLQDVYYDDYDAAPDASPRRGDYVFCGGTNGRDWGFMFEVAAGMTDVPFKVVMPGHLRDRYSGQIPANVEMLCDIPRSRFLELMDGAALVACPLDTQAPAGLIVMFQAAGHSKVILTSDTASARAYVDDTRGFILENDVDKWREAIRQVLAMDDADYYSLCDNMKRFVKEHCSEKLYVATLERHLRNWLE